MTLSFTLCTNTDIAVQGFDTEFGRCPAPIHHQPEIADLSRLVRLLGTVPVNDIVTGLGEILRYRNG